MDNTKAVRYQIVELLAKTLHTQVRTRIIIGAHEYIVASKLVSYQMPRHTHDTDVTGLAFDVGRIYEDHQPLRL